VKSTVRRILADYRIRAKAYRLTKCGRKVIVERSKKRLLDKGGGEE
jgi:hypothetical protein